MRRAEIPISTPCGAVWSEMAPAEARTRLCSACDKVVHDLSAMSESEIRTKLARGPVCVRYLYDAHGNVLVDGAPHGATIVSASALLSKVARSKWLAAAALAATPLVFEACGGVDGNYRENWYQTRDKDAGADAKERPVVAADAGPDDDAGVTDASKD